MARYDRFLIVSDHAVGRLENYLPESRNWSRMRIRDEILGWIQKNEQVGIQLHGARLYHSGGLVAAISIVDGIRYVTTILRLDHAIANSLALRSAKPCSGKGRFRRERERSHRQRRGG